MYASLLLGGPSDFYDFSMWHKSWHHKIIFYIYVTLILPTPSVPNCIAMEGLCGPRSTSVKSLALQILHHPPPHTHTHFVTSHKKWHHQPVSGKAQLSKTRVNKLAPPNMKRQWSREKQTNPVFPPDLKVVNPKN